MLNDPHDTHRQHCMAVISRTLLQYYIIKLLLSLLNFGKFQNSDDIILFYHPIFFLTEICMKQIITNKRQYSDVATG